MSCFGVKCKGVKQISYPEYNSRELEMRQSRTQRRAKKPSSLREVLEAKSLWLGTPREHGRPSPEPRYRPVIYQVGA